MISEYCGDDKSSLSIGLDDSLKALKKQSWVLLEICSTVLN